DASIGGTLQLEFEGVVPTAGTTWNIVNAATLSGPGFSQIATSSPLGRGQYLAVQQAAGGNGALLQATVADGLVLTVHRRTGEIRIVTPSGTGPLDLDGYLITSRGGALDPSFWNSTSDHGVTHFVESNPTSKHVGELSLTGSRQIAA